MTRRQCVATVAALVTPWMLAAQPARAFGAVTYTPPPGWQLTEKPEIHTMTRVQGAHLCMIAVYADEQAGGPSTAAFSKAWTTAFTSASYASAPQPEAVERASPGTYRHLSGEGDLVDRANNRYVARLHLFPLENRTQAIILVGNTRAALSACAPEWDAFSATLRFASLAKVAARETPAPVPGVAAPGPSATGARPRTTFENVEFTPPAGWTVDRSTAGVTLRPTDTQGGEALRVVLLPGRRSTLSLREEFDTTGAAVRASLNAQLTRTINGGAFDLDDPARSVSGWEYLRGSGSMMVDGASWTVVVYTIRAAERVERVVILAKDFGDNISMTNASLNPRYARAIRELVFTLRFANMPSVAIEPATLRGGDITGVWTGLALSGTPKPHYAIFFSNGTAYFSPIFPVRGLLGVDPSLEQPAGKRYWGSYTIEGASGAIRMPYGTIPVRVIDGGSALELTTNRTPHRYVRIAVPDGPMLEGNWCLNGGQCIRLTGGNTGRFEDNGAVRVLEHATYPFPESPPSGSGQYEVRDHTLVLRYDRGPEIRIAFPGVAGGGPAKPAELMLSFNFDVLTRR